MQKDVDVILNLDHNHFVMKIETAKNIVSKATTTFGSRFGSNLANAIDVPQPYVSKLKKFSETGNPSDLPPVKSLAKFETFLNSNTGTDRVHARSLVPTTEVNRTVKPKSEFSLVMTIKDRKTNRFVTGVETTEDELRAAFTEEQTPDSSKSDEQILGEIQTRFRMTNQSVSSIFRGGQSGVIVSGPAGCGKSYNIEKKIQAEQKLMGADFKYRHLKGANMSYTGLYELLFDFRDGGVIVFDDSDKMWDDQDMMNTLKAAMDTSKKRFISNASGGRWILNLAEKNGVEEEEVREFEFKGKIIFITNKDINGLINGKKKGWEHFSALVDRSFYIDLEMFSTRARFLWCEHVFTKFIAPEMGMSQEKTDEIMSFVSANRNRLRGVSVREIETIASVANDPSFATDWKEFIKVTRFKRS